MQLGNPCLALYSLASNWDTDACANGEVVMEVRAKHKKGMCLPKVRASVLDPAQRGDSWIIPCTHPGLLVMYLNNQPVSLVPGSPLELASFNQILFNLRYRPKRQTKKK